MAKVKCAFCDLAAVGCTVPPMCDKHLVIAQVVTRMKGWGWTEITPGTVRNYLLFNWIPGFDVDEVAALCATMPEFQEKRG